MLLEKNLFESGKTLYLQRHDADLPLKFKKTALAPGSFSVRYRRPGNLSDHILENDPPMNSPVPPAFSTCDLCDVHKNDSSGQFRVLPPVFKNFGGFPRFCGPVATVKCFEDNSPVKAAVESPGHGRVLVVDGGASLRRALLGGKLGAAAAENGWAGVVIDGCVRDVGELAQCAVGLRALAAMPLPTEKKHDGLRDIAVQIQGVWVCPGDWLYADEDGMVVMAPPLTA